MRYLRLAVKHKVPTQKGMELGIERVLNERDGRYFQQNLFDSDAQRETISLTAANLIDYRVMGATARPFVKTAATPRRGRLRRGDGEVIRELGINPVNGHTIAITRAITRFYVDDGEVIRAIPKGLPQETITLEQAIALLDDKRERAERRTQRYVL